MVDLSVLSRRNGHFNRRQFLSFATAIGLTPTVIPLNEVFADEPIKILWNGIGLMRACAQSRCKDLESYFWNVYPLLKGKNNDAKLIDDILKDALSKDRNSNRAIKVVWPTRGNQDIGATDYGMFLGITSDRDIASKYYPAHKKTILIFELQMYLFVLNVETFEVIQSYPLRFLEFEIVNGKKDLDTLVAKMGDLILGEKNTGREGTKNFDVPSALINTVSNIQINKTAPVNVRVTKITSRTLTKKWLGSPTINKSSVEFESILGGSLSTAVSDKMKIGIQPYMPTDAIADLTEIYAATVKDKSSVVLQKNLNFAPIGLDLRMVSRGMKVTTKPNKRYKTMKTHRIIIGLDIIAGRWERTYHDNQRQFEAKEKLIEKIFHQQFLMLSVEVTKGTWSNDWYWVLDMHERLFSWFFGLLNEQKYSEIHRGQNVKKKSRQFLFKVKAKEFSKFKLEAKNLRAALTKT